MHIPIGIGDIFLLRVDFQDEPEGFKERPVVVIAVSDEEVVVMAVQITSVGPKEIPIYHDQYKLPILNWQKSGLDKPSWIKTHPNNILRIEISKLNKYKGRVHRTDLKRLLELLELDM